MPHKVLFTVLHTSSVDVGYSPRELEVHNPLVKGWQSSKFSPFPQELILKLRQMVRIKKLQLLAHQYLIPTKVEVYIGSIPPDHTAAQHGTRYKRLGYVTMSDNEKTSYRARELKSVHIDAVGQYIRLVLHKSYINKLNIYNQVGIIAINILGDEVDDDGNLIPDDKQQQVNELISKYMPNGQPYDEKDGATTIDPAVLGAVNNPELISPMDDLAFDMYQDPEIAQIIRKLDLRKNEAVLQEEYEVAKRLKQAIVDLQKVGEKIGRYEVEKRRAIELEDYDLAQVKKTQMDEYRAQIYKQIELHDLLGIPQKEKTQTRSPRNQANSVPARTSELTTQERTSVDAVKQEPRSPRTDVDLPGAYDERPLPTLTNSPRRAPDPPMTEDSLERSPEQVEEADKEELIQNRDMRGPQSCASSPRKAPDAPVSEQSPRRLPDPTVQGAEEGAVEEAGIEEEPEEEGVGAIEEDEEQLPKLNPKVMREASAAIEVFGETTVSNLYAKSWSLRKEGIDDVRSQLAEVSDTDMEHLRSIMRATVFLIRKLLRDGVIAVFRPTLELTTYLVGDWLGSHQLGRHDTSYVVDNVLPELMARIVDTNARLRQASVDYIIALAGMPSVRPLHSIPHHCAVPFKPNSQTKLAVTRVDIVIRLLRDLSLKHSGLKVDNVMTFALKALEHIAQEVRDAAMQLIFELYKTNSKEVRARLPNEEDPKTLKHPLYLKIFDGFNRIDGKPTRAEMKALAKKEREDKKNAKKEEIENLQKQLADLRAATQAAATAQRDGNHLNVNNNQSPRASSPLNRGKQRIRAPSIGEQSEAGEDDQCVFCGEKNDSLKDGGMDVHYWKQCPMLKKCQDCKQVVEISGQTDHLLTECSSQSKYARCPRCSEAHYKTELDKIMSEKTCDPLEEGMARCPLCKTRIPGNDDSWKNHLMGPNGCPLNPRKELKKGKPNVKEKKGPGTTGRQGQRKNKGTKAVKAR